LKKHINKQQMKLNKMRRNNACPCFYHGNVSSLKTFSFVLFIFLHPKICSSQLATFRSAATKTKAAFAAPSRMEENAEGVLYVNSQCISCSACKMLAPDTFDYSKAQSKFIVSHQPDPTKNEDQFDLARAAMAACPVSAIRVENSAQRNHSGRAKLSSEDEQIAKELILSPKINQRSFPFPRPVSGLEGYGIYYLGHHNSASFGAVPYLVTTSTSAHQGDDPLKQMSVMVDTPKFSKAAVKAVLSLTGENGPDYLLITHVDDSADHGKWRDHFPSLKRIFHEGDLGVHNWVGDETLEDVEILLKGKTTYEKDNNCDVISKRGWKVWTLDGDDLNVDSINDTDNHPFTILHTPGHSPGSISLLFKGKNIETESESRHVLFTGDTYAYSAKEESMSGFPLFGNNLVVQSQTLRKFLTLPKLDAILPGHGLRRIYSVKDDENKREDDIEDAVKGLLSRDQ